MGESASSIGQEPHAHFSDLAVGASLRVTSGTLRHCARMTADHQGVAQGMAGLAVVILTFGCNQSRPSSAGSILPQARRSPADPRRPLPEDLLASPSRMGDPSSCIAWSPDGGTTCIRRCGRGQAGISLPWPIQQTMRHPLVGPIPRDDHAVIVRTWSIVIGREGGRSRAEPFLRVLTDGHKVHPYGKVKALSAAGVGTPPPRDPYHAGQSPAAVFAHVVPTDQLPAMTFLSLLSSRPKGPSSCTTRFRRTGLS